MKNLRQIIVIVASILLLASQVSCGESSEEASIEVDIPGLIAGDLDAVVAELGEPDEESIMGLEPDEVTSWKEWNISESDMSVTVHYMIATGEIMGMTLEGLGGTEELRVAAILDGSKNVDNFTSGEHGIIPADTGYCWQAVEDSDNPFGGHLINVRPIGSEDILITLPQKVEMVFDIPSLVGKNIDRVTEILGPGYDDLSELGGLTAPDGTTIELSVDPSFFPRSWEVEGYRLSFDYNHTTRAVDSISFSGSLGLRELAIAGNLDISDTGYSFFGMPTESEAFIDITPCSSRSPLSGMSLTTDSCPDGTATVVQEAH